MDYYQAGLQNTATIQFHSNFKNLSIFNMFNVLFEKPIHVTMWYNLHIYSMDLFTILIQMICCFNKSILLLQLYRLFNLLQGEVPKIS